MKLRKPFRILRNLILFFFISSIGAIFCVYALYTKLIGKNRHSR